MWTELHPLLEREYICWWPYAYLFLLLVAGMGVLLGLKRWYRHWNNRRSLRSVIRKITDAARRETDAVFLRLAARELFVATADLAHSTFPDEVWLKSLSDDRTDFTAFPYRLLLDACLWPTDATPALNGYERESIKKSVIRIIHQKKICTN